MTSYLTYPDKDNSSNELSQLPSVKLQEELMQAETIYHSHNSAGTSSDHLGHSAALVDAADVARPGTSARRNQIGHLLPPESERARSSKELVGGNTSFLV